MALVDSFGREITYLRISVTDRCNLRCAYCMPAEPVHASREGLLTFDEIDRLVGVAVSLGWNKVRLTGGEPLVRRDLVRLVELLGRRKVGSPGRRLETLVMTSNAVLLAPRARALKAAGLDRVNLSLDTLDRERFLRLTGRDRLADVLRGVDAALGAGLGPLKINTVLVRGSTEDEAMDFVDLARRLEVDVRFIEFMPFPGNGWTPEKVLPSETLRLRIAEHHPLERRERRDGGGPAVTYTASGWRGAVSFISPLGDRAFCSRCNRMRLTSEGTLRGCLLDEAETDFRGAIRGGATDDDLAGMFRRAVAAKRERHPYHDPGGPGGAAIPADGRGMHRIGG